LICGDSLLLAGLEAELRRAPGLQAQALKVSEILAETLKVSQTFRVLVVYDQAETDLGQFAPWLTNCPHLTLLGLDAEHDRIHVVTGHSQAVRAVGDLRRLVLEAAVERDTVTRRANRRTSFQSPASSTGDISWNIRNQNPSRNPRRNARHTKRRPWSTRRRWRCAPAPPCASPISWVV
jgi:hypothetical protein